MPISELRFIKRCAEFCPKDQIGNIPHGTRGIYALLRCRPKANEYEVIYIGMARGKGTGVAGRLRSHRRKKPDWTHFSVFEVWDNITEAEVAELEGLFRHIYRKDPTVNRINQQRGFRKLKKVRNNNLPDWRT